LPWPARSAARTRASLTAPRKTLSNADRHCSSVVLEIVPGGVPPALISAPSRREKRSRAASISRPGVAGSALSAATQVTSPLAAAFRARRPAAVAAVVSVGELSTTRAPSAMRASAAANPRPRLPPVTRYTLLCSPRSMPQIPSADNAEPTIPQIPSADSAEPTIRRTPVSWPGQAIVPGRAWRAREPGRSPTGACRVVARLARAGS
jgi:hypothetical protein